MTDITGSERKGGKQTNPFKANSDDPVTTDETSTADAGDAPTSGSD
ncbi:hypothetical protein Q9S36_08035 [Microbacterium sp. ARD31]|jgi:hypothetical protein|nr:MULTISPECIES: hypothetical protein [unclassified Microbacterium]MDT0180158.1 hypothetical protein [Microbacterium sp. ARD31]